MTDLTDLTAGDAAAAIRTGEVTAVELLDDVLRRAAFTESHLYAYLEILCTAGATPLTRNRRSLGTGGTASAGWIGLTGTRPIHPNFDPLQGDQTVADHGLDDGEDPLDRHGGVDALDDDREVV